MRNLFLALFIALISASAANAKCEVGKLLELKVTMDGTQPIAQVGINGRSLPFVVDSGAFVSTISPVTAQQLGLPLDFTHIELVGVGGTARRTYITTVRSLDLSGVSLHNLQFVVGGSEVGASGLLGQNILGIGDVEYDLGHGNVRLMQSKGCSGADNLAYWAGDRPVSDLTIEPRDALHPYTKATVLVNGVKLLAIFDTGAGTSMMSLSAAKRAGLSPTSAGVVEAGVTRGVGTSMVNTWLAPIQSVEIGTEKILNIKLRMSDVDLPGADMLIGADFFLSHRVYVANASRRMYFTYDGGAVFNATPSKIVDHAGATQTLAADNSPAPTDASGFSRRGAADTARRDYKAALADLDRAVAMDPSNGTYLLQRSRTQFLAGNPSAASADLDQAVKVAPTDPEIRLARAEILFEGKRSADAVSDLEAADAALSREADARLDVATMYERLDQFDKAIADYGLWIAAHPDDSRQPLALNGRCWTRALAGRDLPLALKDCEAALRRAKSGSFFDSRGLVELRMAEYDRAIADYTTALQLEPKSAWSLYGRGLARRHKNDPSSQADLNAAVAIDPALPSRARALGIS